MAKAKTLKDAHGRVWEYCDAEGCWTYKKHCIGCGYRNGSKWSDWNDHDGPEEFKTLQQAMTSVYYRKDT